ncbi:hypothetical protein [Halorussus caseinilyticus]|uniref:Uncharacterized protein n=1 Tax=Halorussus caseinilyticus TaxID=3034025 RepID=A0ABD5WLP4_9EURY
MRDGERTLDALGDGDHAVGTLEQPPLSPAVETVESRPGGQFRPVDEVEVVGRDHDRRVRPEDAQEGGEFPAEQGVAREEVDLEEVNHVGLAPVVYRHHVAVFERPLQVAHVDVFGRLCVGQREEPDGEGFVGHAYPKCSSRSAISSVTSRPASPA